MAWIGGALVAIVVIALLVSSLGSGSKSGGLKAPTTSPTPTAPAPTPGVYKHEYNTNFFFSGQQINVIGVRVTGLNGSHATIEYRILITPIGTNRGWINKTNFYIVQANTKTRASLVRYTTSANVSTTEVVFHVPRSLLDGRVFLSINYPTSEEGNRGENVKLALDVPPSS
jgi:hypothetical protein